MVTGQSGVLSSGLSLVMANLNSAGQIDVVRKKGSISVAMYHRLDHRSKEAKGLRTSGPHIKEDTKRVRNVFGTTGYIIILLFGTLTVAGALRQALCNLKRELPDTTLAQVLGACHSAYVGFRKSRSARTGNTGVATVVRSALRGLSQDYWPENKGTKAKTAEDANEKAGRVEAAGGPALDNPEPTIDIEEEEPAVDLNQSVVETHPGFIERTAESPGPIRHSDDLLNQPLTPDSPGSFHLNDDMRSGQSVKALADVCRSHLLANPELNKVIKFHDLIKTPMPKTVLPTLHLSSICAIDVNVNVLGSGIFNVGVSTSTRDSGDKGWN
ncbi:hypothetical protein CONLIGDRAFT_687640 [Coniochaeta ligniaria NRRL 30616]|uniref:Uncharacterized protein n=1 Tax=Coniochaeta ligniaria NRRL 30616 TaxID=1408157 RepID=A0A1J7IMK7_9PEZI|nr:hypothetical protein CONLIGDRAFT_687640 [Coniochaeta ligniaria NRRL 30616]